MLHPSTRVRTAIPLLEQAITDGKFTAQMMLIVRQPQSFIPTNRLLPATINACKFRARVITSISIRSYAYRYTSPLTESGQFSPPSLTSNGYICLCHNVLHITVREGHHPANCGNISAIMYFGDRSLIRLRQIRHISRAGSLRSRGPLPVGGWPGVKPVYDLILHAEGEPVVTVGLVVSEHRRPGRLDMEALDVILPGEIIRPVIVHGLR